MNPRVIHITEEGHQKLIEKLKFLKTVKRRELSKDSKILKKVGGDYK